MKDDHCFKFSGIIIAHHSCNGDCGLKYLLEKQHIEPTELLATNPLSHFDQVTSRSLASKKVVAFKPGSYYCTGHFFEDIFHFFYNQRNPPGLYRFKNVAKQQTSKETPNNDDFLLRIDLAGPTIQFSGKTPLDHDQLFCSANVFQVPHHAIRPKLSQSILRGFPDQKHIENAAKLLALYQNKDLLSAEIDQLAPHHALYKKASGFHAYMFTKETKDSHNESKFEKGFRKMFLTHERLANDPDDCYTIDNPQVAWYYNDGMKIFSNETRETVEQERKKQLKMILYLCECVEWAYFYQKIDADLYFVSGGLRSMPITLQVLIGIMIAHRKKKQRCRIVLTNNAVVKEIRQCFPKVVRDFVSSNTDFWYLNDFNYNMPIQVKHHAFFTIDSYHKPHALKCSMTKADLESPKVVCNTAEPRDIHAEGMKNLHLNDIRTEEDFVITSISSFKMRIAFRSSTQKLKVRAGKESYLLGQYLKLIGHPTPYELIAAECVLECVVGSILVGQLKNSSYNNFGLTDLDPKLLEKIFSTKVKGQSEFTLNATKTAASSAIIYLHNFAASVANKLVNVCNARFIIHNAKCSNMSFKFESSLMKEPIDLRKHSYTSSIGCIGVTLAEYIAFYDPKQAFWPYAKHQAVGKVLNITLGKQEAIAVLQNIPLFLSFTLTTCTVKHYLSYYSFDENSILQEACIHMEPPEHLSLCDGIEIQVSSLSMHILPKNEVNERGVQIQGTGLIKGIPVQLKQSSLHIPNALEIIFSDKFTLRAMFDLLGFTDSSMIDYCLLNEHLEDDKQYNIMLHCSHTIPGSVFPELELYFQSRIDIWQALLPQSMVGCKVSQTYVTVHSFNSSKPIQMNRAKLAVCLNYMPSPTRYSV